MINSLTVTNHLGESIKLELRFPEKSGFLVQGIDGLGPAKANINTTEMSTTDGALYNSSRVNSRNILFKLIFMHKPTIEDSRQLCYKYFPIKKRIHILIETDNRICETYGHVESNEPDIFSNQEGTQISVICPDPYFYSAGPDANTTSVFYAITPTFQFPFGNASLTENLITFATIINQPIQTIVYEGDADVGILITIHAMGTATNVTIYNTETRESMKFDTDRLTAMTGSPIISGDDIIISTIKGNKYVTLLRDGVYINALNCLDKGTNWFQLSKGDNIFAYTAETGYLNLGFRIDNKKVYEGV